MFAFPSRPVCAVDRSSRLGKIFATLCAVFLVAAFAASPVAVAQDDDLFGDLSPDATLADAGSAPAAPAPAADAPAAPVEGAAVDAAASGAEGEEAPKGENYLVWMFRSLGLFFTLVFSVLSLSMVALIVVNSLALRRDVVAPEELATKFGALLDENRFQDAYQLAKDDESILGKTLAIGLSKTSAGYAKAEQAMRDVQEEETMRLEHQIGYLALIGNLAPMIGLFGTVVGMIASFQAIAAGGAAPSPQKLAEGIATALFTTELGLAIALPALFAFDFLKNRLARFMLDVSVLSENLMGRFANVQAPKAPSTPQRPTGSPS
ncbi:MAG: MotA/TolQ/ExbB proton channel family protein [Thermoguttaceae bacterium]|nr:MotA/TolQ/ExbB proton channel family protein [Thermoguttaceae bacterium]